MSKLSFYIVLAGSILFTLLSSGCSKDDETIRTPVDIVGIWSNSLDHYIEFNGDYTARMLEITEVDGESIGTWYDDVYFYEPGYNLVIYLDFPTDVLVYQITNLTPTELQWCWVKSLRDEYNADDEIGKIIGDIIKEAQEGFKLDPEHYQTFYRIPEDRFLEILENITIMEPW